MVWPYHSDLGVRICHRTHHWRSVRPEALLGKPQVPTRTTSSTKYLQRWIFWLNFPFCGLAFVLIPIFLRHAPLPATDLRSKFTRIDPLGSFLFVASLTTFLIPLSWGGVMYAWTSAHTLAPLIIGFFGLVVFVLYSSFLSPNPVITGRIFTTRTAIVNYFGTTIHGLILWSALYYLPLYYQTAKSLSPVLSGVALFPQTFTVAPIAAIAGVFITRSGRYRPPIWAGWFLTTLGVGLLILLDSSTPTVSWIFLNLVSGLGIGLLYPAMSFAVQASASNADLPSAAAMFSFFRSLGQTLGVAVGGVIFQNRMEHNLDSYPLLAPHARAYSNDASALVQTIISLGKTPQELKMKEQLVESYVQALRVVWIVMCGFAGLAMLLAVAGTKELGLDREHRTDQGYVGRMPNREVTVEEGTPGETHDMDRLTRPKSGV